MSKTSPKLWLVTNCLVDTMWCHYYMVNFLQNTHNRHPIPHPLSNGCLLWVWYLIMLCLSHCSVVRNIMIHINIGLLPDGTEPLFKPMLMSHKWGPVDLTWWHFHIQFWRYQSIGWVKISHFQIYCHISRGPIMNALSFSLVGHNLNCHCACIFPTRPLRINNTIPNNEQNLIQRPGIS